MAYYCHGKGYQKLLASFKRRSCFKGCNVKFPGLQSHLVGSRTECRLRLIQRTRYDGYPGLLRRLVFKLWNIAAVAASSPMQRLQKLSGSVSAQGVHRTHRKKCLFVDIRPYSCAYKWRIPQLSGLFHIPFGGLRFLGGLYNVAHGLHIIAA